MLRLCSPTVLLKGEPRTEKTGNRSCAPVDLSTPAGTMRIEIFPSGSSEISASFHRAFNQSASASKAGLMTRSLSFAKSPAKESSTAPLPGFPGAPAALFPVLRSVLSSLEVTSFPVLGRGVPIAVAAPEIPELALVFLPVHTVLLLVPARELIVPAGDHAEPVIGQLPPAFSYAAGELLPLAC